MSRIFIGAAMAVLVVAQVQAGSFHVEIPVREGYSRYLQQAIDYNTKQYPFCPDVAMYQRGDCGVQFIVGDGRYVSAMVGTYSIPDHRTIQGAMGPLSDNGLTHLSVPLLALDVKQKVFTLRNFPADAYAGAELPAPKTELHPGPTPEDAAFVMARALSGSGDFVVGEYRYEGKARLAAQKNPDGSFEKAYADGRKSLTTSDAFFWSQATGYRLFPRPQGWRTDGHYSAFGLTGDGNTVLATIYDNQAPWDNQRPVLIDRRTNVATALPHFFQNSNASTEAALISADGSTVVGTATAGKGQTAEVSLFTWTRPTGYSTLRIPEGSHNWRLNDISADGSLVVGSVMFPQFGLSTTAPSGMVWKGGEPQGVEDYLTAQGLDVAGWKLTSVTHISDDGLVLGGQADGVKITGVPWFAYLGEKRLDFPTPRADITFAEVRDWSFSFGQRAAAEQPDSATPAEIETVSVEAPATVDPVSADVPPASVPAEPTPVPPSPQPSPQPSEAAQIGCWQWSNGLKISIGADGTAHNGFVPAPWKAISASEFEIDWPDFTGTITLSADGQSLSGLDSLGQRSTAQRVNGDPQSFVGNWRWDNGGIVTISEDGNMQAGALRGTWSGSGERYNTVWPLVDRISVSADGKTLVGQNQFGSFTAEKGSGCPH